MKVTMLICRVIEGYRVGVLHVTKERTRHWVQCYPLADLCINQLVEYELASVFDAVDFRNSRIHTEGGILIHHAETDEETLKDAGFDEQTRAN